LVPVVNHSQTGENKMKRVMAFSGLVLLLLVMVAGVFAQDSIEVGDTVEGTLSESNEEYSLTLSAGDTLVIALDSEDFDAYLEVYDSSGNMVAYNDDGGQGTNARLLFVAAEDDTYTINVRSYFGMGTGVYVLSVSPAEITPLTYNKPLRVELDGGDMLLFVFSGEEGDVINIIADSGNELDTHLTLKDPSDFQIAYNDDSSGVDPALLRVLLRESGNYILELGTYGGRELQGVVTLLIEETELLTLDDGPQVITFDDELSTEVLGVTVDADVPYRLTVTSQGTEISLWVEVRQGERYISSLSFSSVTEASFVLTFADSGLTMITLNDSSFFWDEASVIEVSLEAVE
jgi:hypothetical protein